MDALIAGMSVEHEGGMQIVNETERALTYEILGGPVRMVMSTAELAPGEAEIWEVPRAYRSPDLECEVRVRQDDGDLREAVPPEGLVRLVESDGTLAVELG